MSTRVARLPEDLLLNTAGCLFEIFRYRQTLGEHFHEYPHGQMLVGFVKGVAAGLGIEPLELIGYAKPYLTEPGMDEFQWLPEN